MRIRKTRCHPAAVAPKLAAIGLLVAGVAAVPAAAPAATQQRQGHTSTATPIRHLVVIF